MASNMIVDKWPLSMPPTQADRKLARLAAGLVTVAKRGDEAGVRMLLNRAEPYQLARMFMIVGSFSDQDAVLAAAGFGDESEVKRLSSEYGRLKKEGVAVEDMPPHVVQGRRIYWRLWHRAKVARAKREEHAA